MKILTKMVTQLLINATLRVPGNMLQRTSQSVGDISAPNRVS